MNRAAGVLTMIALAGAACRAAAPGAPAAASAEKARVLAFWQAYHAATERRVAGDLDRAVARYAEALALDPRHEDSLYYLGQCERLRGRAAEARQAFERLLAVNAHSGRGHLALGALLAAPDPAAALDLAAAEAHFRAAHAINGEETGPMVRLAEVLIVAGRAPEARTWLEAAVRTNARSVEAALLAAALAWGAGDRAGARAMAAAATAASTSAAPVKGVLSEGDRKAGPQRTAAPPLEQPMGRMLFGDALTGARAALAAAAPALDLEALWQAVSLARAGYARRAARPDEAAAAVSFRRGGSGP